MKIDARAPNRHARNVRIPAELDDQLRRRAADLDRSVHWTILRAIRLYLGAEGDR